MNIKSEKGMLRRETQQLAQETRDTIKVNNTRLHSHSAPQLVEQDDISAQIGGVGFDERLSEIVSVGAGHERDGEATRAPLIVLLLTHDNNFKAEGEFYVCVCCVFVDKQ
jgi:hypothetical protein